MFVRNWMSSPALTIESGLPASSAREFMEKRQVRRLPVVDDGLLVGIVTLSDLALSGSKSRNVQQLKVRDVMTAKPHTVDRDDTLEAAAQIMIRDKVSGLPVLDGGRVVGILTESDLFGALCEMLGVGETGARVAMTVKDEEDLLDAIRRKTGTLAIRSLVTVHDPKRSEWSVVARVRGRVASARKPVSQA